MDNMTANAAIKLASEAVGHGKPDDYIISPVRHAEEFRSRLPDLSAILSSSVVITTAQQYEREDQEALDAQTRFKRVFNRANLATLSAAILVAVILAVGTLTTNSSSELSRIVIVILSLGSVVTGALASKDMFLIKQGSLLEDWMSRRASAETTRLDYFESIARSPESTSKSGDIPTDLLKLEYFRRFQLEVQLAYYTERSKQHGKNAAKTISLAGWAIAGAAIASGSAGILTGAAGSEFAALAALAAVFTAISSFASLGEAVSQDRRNSERYGRTSRVLEDLKKRLDDVRLAVYLKGSKPLTDFVEAVHEQLSVEHRQWLGELGEARGAFAKLESTLADTLAVIKGREQ